MLKLHLFDLLWICCTACCTTNPQQIESCATNPQYLDMSRCCGFVVQQAVQQIHNKSKVVQQINNILTCQDVVDLLYNKLYNKSTTNRKLYNKSTIS